MQCYAKEHLSTNIVKSIYYAIFGSHLDYVNLIWGQNIKAIERLTILHKKPLKLMDLKPRNFHTSPLFLSLNILKLPDKTILENYLLTSKAISNFLPSVTGFHFHPRRINTRDPLQLKSF